MSVSKNTPNPTGFCMCGCGSLTEIAKQTKTDRGQVRGEHCCFIKGHGRRGTGHSLTEIDEIKRTAMCAECGLVRIKRNGSIPWKCCRIHPDNMTLSHKLTDIDSEQRTGTCSVCGPSIKVVKGFSTIGWKCHVVTQRHHATAKIKRTPEQIESTRVYMTQYNIDNKDKTRKRHLLKNYGITVEDYENMLTYQNSVCAICGNGPMPSDRGGILHVDHCHKTGNVRGLLCGDCNKGIGIFKDDPDRLIKAANYLRIDNEIDS